MVIKVNKPTNQVVVTKRSSQRVYYIMFVSLSSRIMSYSNKLELSYWSYHTGAISKLMIQTQISPCYACSCFLKSNLIHILIENNNISRAIVQHFVINGVLI